MISIQKSPGSRIVPTEGLLLIAALVVGVDLSMGLTPLGVLRLSFLTALSAVPLLELSFPGGRWVRFFKKFTIRSGMPAVFLTAVAAILMLDFMILPASAQFMNNAQSWMEGQFSAAADIIPLVFNVLRGLFLLYIGIALVKVINAAREDEDWKSLARTPLIILIAVTLGDILAGLITG